MKYIAVFGIDFYRLFISPILKNMLGVSRCCRFSQSCSAYAKSVIIREGIYKGVYLSLIRLSRCQPFAADTYV